MGKNRTLYTHRSGLHPGAKISSATIASALTAASASLDIRASVENRNIADHGHAIVAIERTRHNEHFHSAAGTRSTHAGRIVRWNGKSLPWNPSSAAVESGRLSEFTQPRAVHLPSAA